MGIRFREFVPLIFCMDFQVHESGLSQIFNLTMIADDDLDILIVKN